MVRRVPVAMAAEEDRGDGDEGDDDEEEARVDFASARQISSEKKARPPARERIGWTSGACGMPSEQRPSPSRLTSLIESLSSAASSLSHLAPVIRGCPVQQQHTRSRLSPRHTEKPIVDRIIHSRRALLSLVSGREGGGEAEGRDGGRDPRRTVKLKRPAISVDVWPACAHELVNQGYSTRGLGDRQANGCMKGGLPLQKAQRWVDNCK